MTQRELIQWALNKIKDNCENEKQILEQFEDMILNSEYDYQGNFIIYPFEEFVEFEDNNE